MNNFISEMFRTMGIGNAQKLNCCRTEGTIIDDTKVGFTITLPGGTAVEIYTPTEISEPAEEGFAYVPQYDIESPDMCAEDLGDWLDTNLECCRRIDAYYNSIKGRSTELNSALDTDLAIRIKDVFRAAQSAVDLPPGFRYTAFRENKADDLILSTLMYTSQKLGTTQWVAKSSLTVDATIGADEPGTDDWSFEPNYNPNSEGHLIYHRQGRFIDVEQGMYGYTATGDTAEKRDRMTAYWLAGLLSDMVDSMLQNPPARCYEYFLADGIAELKKSDLDRMSTPGVMRLVTKGYVDPEKVLKAKPTLAKDLVTKGLIAPEIVARRAPDRILWLVQQGYISPDYAVKVDPTIKDKLVKKGLYAVAEDLPDEPEAILEGVKAGTIKPIDAYRKNAKLLQPMVEQELITPQEAYRLDASIVTWLLLNKYIGRKEAMKVKPDIQKYIARKYKDVNWDDLDASLGGDENTTEVLTGEITEDTLQAALTRAIEKDPDTPNVDVQVGDIVAFVAPAGYNDNEMIASGDLANATVYVTLFKDYRIIRTDSGSPDKRMKGSDAVNYIKQAAASYEMLHGDDDLDSAKEADKGTDCNAAKDESMLDKLKAAFKKRQSKMKQAEGSADTAQLRKDAGLNSSLNFNSDAIGNGDMVGESATVDTGTNNVFEAGDFAAYGLGYENLRDTQAQGPGFVAECMLPEDDFDGIVVPGDSEDIAKETLMQMLLANDGTFIDWKPVSDIQAFKTENAAGNFLVLN